MAGVSVPCSYGARLGRHRERPSWCGASDTFRAELADGCGVEGLVFPGELMWDDDALAETAGELGRNVSFGYCARRETNRSTPPTQAPQHGRRSCPGLPRSDRWNGNPRPVVGCMERFAPGGRPWARTRGERTYAAHFAKIDARNGKLTSWSAGSACSRASSRLSAVWVSSIARRRPPTRRWSRPSASAHSGPGAAPARSSEMTYRHARVAVVR